MGIEKERECVCVCVCLRAHARASPPVEESENMVQIGAPSWSTKSSGKHLMSSDVIEIPGARFLQFPPLRVLWSKVHNIFFVLNKFGKTKGILSFGEW